jgi:NADH:ubiquinone oxidoreductase subunit E
MLRGGCHTRDNQDQNDQQQIIQRIIHRMNEEREKAMIYVLGFFRSKMAAVNKHNVSKVKELLSTHEIYASELVDKYVQLVYDNS